MSQGEKRQILLGYPSFMPFLAVLAVFMSYLSFYTVYPDFFEWNMVKPVEKFVGLANYATIFKDPNSWKITGNTVMYILVLLVLNFILSYIPSSILSAVIKRGQGFYEAVFSLPSVVSPAVGSTPYIWILNPISGPVALVSRCFDLTLSFWSKVEGWVIVVPSVVTSQKVFGYNFIVILAGVSGVSTRVIGVTRPDNVPLWKIFHDMVVPASSATEVYVFTTTIVQRLQYVFTPIKVVIQSGPDYTSSNLIYIPYHKVFTLYHTGILSAVSVITIVLFIVLLLMEFRLMEKGVYYEN